MILTSKKRDALPQSAFGLPGQEKYPITDLKHAAVAKAYAKQEEEKDKLSPSGYDQVVAKANRFQRLHSVMSKGASK